MFNIKPLDVEFEDIKDYEMDDVFYKLIKTVFRTTKAKPTNKDELRKLYISIIKNITNNEIVITKRINTRKEGKRGQYTYFLNNELINRYIELNKFTNLHSKHFMNGFVKEVVNDDVEFVDDIVDDVLNIVNSHGLDSESSESDESDTDSMEDNPLDEGVLWFRG